MPELLQNRLEAGQRLADLLLDYAGREDVVVLALPRGGVPVGAEIADRLEAPLDVYPVRKLGAPQQPELAMGAIAPGNACILNENVVRSLGISEDQIEQVAANERRELERRETLYRKGRQRCSAEGKVAIMVDDGLATGASMKIAVEAVQHEQPAAVVVAVGTAPPSTVTELEQRDDIDRVEAAVMPRMFLGVGGSYADFAQTTDDEVIACLDKTRAPA